MDLFVKMHGWQGDRSGLSTEEFFGEVMAFSRYIDESERYYWTVGEGADATLTAFPDDVLRFIKPALHRGPMIPRIGRTFPHYLFYS